MSSIVRSGLSVVYSLAWKYAEAVVISFVTKKMLRLGIKTALGEGIVYRLVVGAV